MSISSKLFSLSLSFSLYVFATDTQSTFWRRRGKRENFNIALLFDTHKYRYELPVHSYTTPPPLPPITNINDENEDDE